MKGANHLGVNYPQDTDSNDVDVIQLQSHGIGKVRIYNTDASVLRALALTNIEVIVGVNHREILEIGESQENADLWLAQNVLPFVAATKITAIAVGNEAVTRDEASPEALLAAMRNIQAALVSTKLESSIKVSTPCSVLVLGTSAPPSSGSFHHSHSSWLKPILGFLSESNSSFMVNVYPFFLHQTMTQVVSLDYYLFKDNRGTDDPKTGLHYGNYLDAILDSLVSAMSALNFSDIPITVTETSWPSRDHLSQTYNENLLAHARGNSGTPMRPTAEVGIYVTDFFDGVPMHRLTLEGARPHARSLASQVWCVAKSNVSDTALQAALDWACGPNSGQGNVNCGPIQSGQSCYLPNTLQAHCNWAFNTYFQSHNQTSASCDFQGCATLTSSDPSEMICLWNYLFICLSSFSCCIHETHRKSLGNHSQDLDTS